MFNLFEMLGMDNDIIDELQENIKKLKDAFNPEMVEDIKRFMEKTETLIDDIHYIRCLLEKKIGD